MTTPYLKSIRVKHFKAVRDSGVIRLSPLTVFIGNNGSGKSSITEGLETLQAIVGHGLDQAMQQWRGFEHVWHKGIPHTLKSAGHERQAHTNPMSFELRGRIRQETFSAALHVNAGPALNELFIEHEKVVIKNRLEVQRDLRGRVKIQFKDGQPVQYTDSNGEAELGKALDWFPLQWQFVSLVAQLMGSPVHKHRTGGSIRLAKDGSNLADYLLSIRMLDQQAFNGIVDTLQHVLPFARDIQSALTSEVERAVYLQMSEADFKVPGWLLSTGTLRILAFLALFRHPTPPPLIVIEEIENGFDPRTLHLLVDEIRNLVESGRSQVIVTTHSPYLLDLFDLSHIVMVDRADGQPRFTRPADRKSLQEWTKSFSPGRLYTMGLLDKRLT